MKGETGYIKGQHEEARKKFIESNNEITANDVHMDFIKMDKNRYA